MYLNYKDNPRLSFIGEAATCNRHRAINIFRYAIKNYPDNPQLFLSLALSYKEGKHNSLAIDAYDKALNLYPDYYEAWVSKGLFLMEMGQLPRAYDCLYQAYGISPDRVEVNVSLGNLCREIGDYESALSFYNTAISIEEIPALFLHRGCVHGKLNKIDEAFKDFKRALSLNTCEHFKMEVFYYRIRLYEKLERYQEALEDMELIEILHGGEAHWISHKKGMLFYKLGRREEAIKCYYTAIRLDSNCPECHKELKKIMNSSGEDRAQSN